MPKNVSFEDRIARLADKPPAATAAAPAKRRGLPWAAFVTRIGLPLCGIAALGVVAFTVTGDTKGRDVRKGPFDLAGSIRSNMTAQEIHEMNNNPRINRAVSNAPNERTAEMMRLLLSH